MLQCTTKILTLLALATTASQIFSSGIALAAGKVADTSSGTSDPRDWQHFNPYNFQPASLLIPAPSNLPRNASLYPQSALAFPDDPSRANVIYGRGRKSIPTVIYAKAFDVLLIGNKYFQAPAAGQSKQIKVNAQSVTIYGATVYTPLPDNRYVGNPAQITPFDPSHVFYSGNSTWPSVIYGEPGQVIMVGNQPVTVPPAGKSIAINVAANGKIKMPSLQSPASSTATTNSGNQRIGQGAGSAKSTSQTNQLSGSSTTNVVTPGGAKASDKPTSLDSNQPGASNNHAIVSSSPGTVTAGGTKSPNPQASVASNQPTALSNAESGASVQSPVAPGGAKPSNPATVAAVNTSTSHPAPAGIGSASVGSGGNANNSKSISGGSSITGIGSMGGTGSIDDSGAVMANQYIKDVPGGFGFPSKQIFSLQIDRDVCWYYKSNYKPAGCEHIKGTITGDINITNFHIDIGNGISVDGTLQTQSAGALQVKRVILLQQFTKGDVFAPANSNPLTIAYKGNSALNWTDAGAVQAQQNVQAQPSFRIGQAGGAVGSAGGDSMMGSFTDPNSGSKLGSANDQMMQLIKIIPGSH